MAAVPLTTLSLLSKDTNEWILFRINSATDVLGKAEREHLEYGASLIGNSKRLHLAPPTAIEEAPV